MNRAVLATNAIVTRPLYEVERTGNSRLIASLWHSTQLLDHFATQMFFADQMQLENNFGVSTAGYDHGEGAYCNSVVGAIKAWIRAHEEAQVMMASILVVVGLWWLVRAVLSLLISLVCPILVVLLAVVLVPQLRGPLLGQNYPALANVLHNVLTAMAENIKES